VEIFIENSCKNLKGSGQSLGNTLEITTASLPEGNYTFFAKSTDLAGNSSSCSSVSASYLLDLTPPAKPSQLAFKDGITSPGNEAEPVITVNGVEKWDTVELFLESSCEKRSVFGLATGKSINLKLSSLKEGNYTFYAKSTDLAGNRSACSSSSLSYLLDLTPPNVPNNLLLKNPSKSPGNKKTPEITVNGVDTDDMIQIFTNSSCDDLEGMGTAVGKSIDILINPLEDGKYSFYAMSTDLAGNSSACSTNKVSYLLDTSPPDQPKSLKLKFPIKSPGNYNTPLISVGGVNAGNTVNIYTDKDCLNKKGSGIAAGNNLDIDLLPLLDGSYTFYAKSTDLAGNSSACSTSKVSYIVDTIPPGVPKSPVLKYPSEAIGNVTNPILSVKGLEKSDDVKLFLDEYCTNELSSGISKGPSLDLTTTDLADGNYNFYAQSTDLAGNSSACSGPSTLYIVDTMPPGTPDPPVLKDPLKNIGNIKTPTLTVNGLSGKESIGLFSDSNCSKELSNGISSGTGLDLTSSFLADGTYYFYAKSTDQAGNISNCSGASESYTVDTIPPQVPVVTLKAPDKSPVSVLKLRP
ncbi:hypothetical protein OAK75_14265, partial [Bacteriovoracales bacterium]|nr:hypothetical protein [Bacteriovoracales bacterium]